ncbi:MAG: MFS transporter [Chitinophagaceae bacterium]|nr:MFS transporter [Chitinophagaceae bacterium]
MLSNKTISKTIWLISLVSLFTDMASEMLYPVMPVYLKAAGYSVVFIGVLEGFAEAIAGLGKSYFGRWSDAAGKRLPFVQLGYLLSSISKPMLAISTQWWLIFTSRFIDRAGKGMRTAPRDAMLNAETTAANKATVFGFHRAMDTFGAVLGPLIALLFLHFYPGNYTSLFLLAFVPGVLAVGTTLLLKENKTASPKKAIPQFHQTFTYWKQAPAGYKKLIAALLLFAAINSSDVFLLLKMKEAGLADVSVIGIYVFCNLVYAVCAYPLGRLADKTGMKTIFIAGLLLYAVTYTGFSFAHTMPLFTLFIATYGLYAAATEGVAKAWISSVVPAAENASAIGFYTGFQSIAALLASTFAGFLWVYGSNQLVFLLAAVAALLVAVWLLVSFQKK